MGDRPDVETAPWETAPPQDHRCWRRKPARLEAAVAALEADRSLQPPPPSTAGARGLAAQQELINHHLQQQEAAAPDAALPGDQLSADQKLEFFEFCIIALPTLCYILPL